MSAPKHPKLALCWLGGVAALGVLAQSATAQTPPQLGFECRFAPAPGQEGEIGAEGYPFPIGMVVARKSAAAIREQAAGDNNRVQFRSRQEIRMGSEETAPRAEIVVEATWNRARENSQENIEFQLSVNPGEVQQPEFRLGGTAQHLTPLTLAWEGRAPMRLAVLCSTRPETAPAPSPSPSASPYPPQPVDPGEVARKAEEWLLPARRSCQPPKVSGS
jgi:hypothetical protein